MSWASSTAPRQASVTTYTSYPASSADRTGIATHTSVHCPAITSFFRPVFSTPVDDTRVFPRIEGRPVDWRDCLGRLGQRRDETLTLLEGSRGLHWHFEDRRRFDQSDGMIDELARIVRANREHLQILVVDHQQRMIIRAEQRLGWIRRHRISPLAACRVCVTRKVLRCSRPRSGGLQARNPPASSRPGG